MLNHKNRPVFLNLLRIHFPVTAVVSILHRVSGLLMVLSLPVLIYLLRLSLQGPAGYDQARALVTGPAAQCVGFVLVWALAHHLLAGLRFLLLDVEIGVTKKTARLSAWLVHGGAAAAAVAYLGAVW